MRLVSIPGEVGGGRPIGEHLERHYGIAHASIIAESHLAIAAACGFERGDMAYTPAYDDRSIATMHDMRRSTGQLPAELTDQDAFVRRFRQLIGTLTELGEVGFKVYGQGPLPGTPLGKQREFERDVARRYIGVLARAGALREEALAPPQVVIEEDKAQEGRRLLRTQHNLRVLIARQTNGQVIQLAPSIRSTLQRVYECQQGIISGAVLLSPSYFGREVSKIIAERAGVQDKVTFGGSGLMADIEELRERAVFDTAHYAPGFGALIIGFANRIPKNDILAIQAARELLATNGVAIMAGGISLARTQTRYADVTSVLATLRESFGPPLRESEVLHQDAVAQALGTQALFIKR